MARRGFIIILYVRSVGCLSTCRTGNCRLLDATLVPCVAEKDSPLQRYRELSRVFASSATDSPASASRNRRRWPTESPGKANR